MSKREIKEVYESVVDHLKLLLQRDNVHGFIGSFEDHVWPAIDKRRDYIEIPIFQLKGIDVVDFLKDCEEHPCFISAMFGSRSGDTCLITRFLWINPEDYRGHILRYIVVNSGSMVSKQKTWSFGFLLFATILVVAMGFLKEVKKFPF